MINNKQQGFIALFSVIIISFVLLLMTITSNFSGISSRFNIFDSENKARSNELANACIEQARLKIALENTFIGTDDEVEIGEEICGYEVFSGGIIKSWAEVNKANTYYGIRVNKDEPNIPITCFQELLNEDDNINLSTCP